MPPLNNISNTLQGNIAFPNQADNTVLAVKNNNKLERIIADRFHVENQQIPNENQPLNFNAEVIEAKKESESFDGKEKKSMRGRFIKLLTESEVTIEMKLEVVKRLESASNEEVGHIAFHLGGLFLHGIKIPRDQKVARQWFSIALKIGHIKACFSYGAMLHDGLGGDVDRPLAAEMFEKAAIGGCPEAVFNWAQCLYAGDGVPQNKEEALKLFKVCADEYKLPLAQYQMGCMLYDGTEIDKNLFVAFEMFTLAAKEGLKIAKLQVAWMMFQGSGCEENKPEAAKLFQELAEFDELRKAQFLLGRMLRNGDGIPEDKFRAAEMFARAATQECPRAIFNLAEMYESGDGIERNIIEALRWYKKGANLNDPLCVGKVTSLMIVSMSMDTLCT